MILADKLRMGPSKLLMFVSVGTGTNSVSSMPKHQAGDVLIAYAANTGTSIPSRPSGWTTQNSSNSSGVVAWTLAYKVATSDAETSGTWTNAKGLIIAVYRNQATTPVFGNASGYSSPSTTTVTVGSFTPAASTSFVLAGVATQTPNISGIGNAPTGMVNRAFVANANISMALHDTNQGVASWASTTVSVGATISGYANVRTGINQK